MTTIHVNAEHIRHGISQECCHCPVALALFEQTKTPYVVAGCHVVGLDKVEIPLPENARAFIAAFDEGEPVKPFAFEIDLPA